MSEITGPAFEEVRKRIDGVLDTHDKRLNGHSERIDKLEQYQARTEVKIENLCDQIKSLVSTIRWAMGIIGGSLVGFFIWYVQNIGG